MLLAGEKLVEIAAKLGYQNAARTHPCLHLN